MRDRNDTELKDVNEAGQLYAAAYATHYTTRDLREALELYRSLMATHPNTPEAGYSQSQVQNIAHAVVPKQELLDAHLALALAHIERGDQADVRQPEVAPHAMELTT